MISANYGRMRIGRCVKAEEVDAHKAIVGDDPRYLGCSTDVLQKLDQKCTGRTDCEFRVYDIVDENMQPCFPGLKMYLEASYTCINGEYSNRKYPRNSNDSIIIIIQFMPTLYEPKRLTFHCLGHHVTFTFRHLSANG